MLLVGIGGGACFSGINLWNGNEKFYNDYIMPLIKHVDPERSHRFAVLVMKYCLIRKQQEPDPPTLVCYLFFYYILILILVTLDY
jgi:hypothetical protein